MTESATPMLSARGVKTYYGNIIALKGVDIDVRQGEIVTMIGANGAGKSTLLKVLAGLTPFTGSVELLGQPMQSLPAKHVYQMRQPHQSCRANTANARRHF